MKTLEGGRASVCQNVTPRIVFGSKYAHWLARLETQARSFVERIFTGWDTDMAQDRAKGEVRFGTLEYAIFLAGVSAVRMEAVK